MAIPGERRGYSQELNYRYEGRLTRIFCGDT